MFRTRYKLISALIGAALLIAWWLAGRFWQRVDTRTTQERFIYDIAIQFREPNLCRKIGPFALGRDMWGGMTPAPGGYQITYLQSDCYLFLATALHDYSLCDKVRPLRSGLKDGSKITPEYCRVSSDFTEAIPDVYTIVPMMQKLGYDNRAIYDFQYRNLYTNPIRKAYAQLLKEDQFAEKVRTAPTFDEPITQAQNRPANDLEYLYEMFANDTNDSDFCDKISPNAMSEQRTSRGFQLRFQCYNNIAFNEMDIRKCEKLPTTAHLHSEAKEFNLREDCSYSVEIMRRDPSAKLLRWGPEFPPTYASFQRALHEVGYDPALPESTYSDYEDFVEFLATSKAAELSARSEFLRRVESMN